MKYVVDASVAIKWYIPEILSDKAMSYLEMTSDGQALFMAPDLILPELGNVLWKKHRQRELSLEDVRLINQTICETFPAKLVESRLLLPPATEIALATGLTVYDSLYFSLAAIENAVLVTADKRLASVVTQLADLVEVELLE